jgi:OmpA-OmpF porin, OOP family
MMIKHISAAALALFAFPAFAQEIAAPAATASPNAYYLGLDAGRTHDDFDKDGSSLGIFAGYQVNRYLSVEAGYRRMLDRVNTFAFQHPAGYMVTGETHMRMDQRSLSALGSWPLTDKVNLLGRVGYNEVVSRYKWDNYRQKGLLLGAGVSYKLAPNIDARLEFQRASDETRNVSAGIAYKF